MTSEMNHGANRDARAVGGAARVEAVYASVVHLRAQAQVGKNREINSSAKAIGKVVGRSSQCGYAPVACEELHKGSDVRRIVNDDPWPKEVCVRIQRNAARRGMIRTEVADEAQEGDGLVG